MKEMKFDVVSMKEVPEPPMGGRRINRYEAVYAAMKKLGFGQNDAVRLPVNGPKHLTYGRAQLRNMAKKEGLRLLSSRNQDSTVAFFWLIKPGKD